MPQDNTIFKKGNTIKTYNTYKNTLLITLLLVIVCPLIAQDINLNGVVTDKNNNGLIGAHVIVKDANNSCITNEKGEFELNNLFAQNYTIEISYLGYETKQVIINPEKSFKNLSIQLEESSQKLEEIEVTSNHARLLTHKESVSIELIQEEFLMENKAPSLLKSLNKISGVNCMSIGSSMAKPVIRGLGYYRVVVANKGIKLEGQQWSSHFGVHLDNNSTAHIELIKGPASLRYGSDAIGGVINILPLHTPLRQGISGDVSFMGNSNNQSLNMAANLSSRKGDFFTQSSLSYTSYGDFSVPETDSFSYSPTGSINLDGSHQAELGKYIYNTAGHDLNANFSAGIIKTWGNTYVEVSNYNTKAGFFDWMSAKNFDNIESHMESNRDIQLPYLSSNHFSINSFTNIFRGKNKLELAFGYQNNLAQEFSYLQDLTGSRPDDLLYYQNLNNLDLEFNLSTYSANAVYSLRNYSKQEICIGVNNQYQHHKIDGFNYLLPAYTRFSSGIFISHSYKYSEKWIINTGIRTDYSHLKISETINPDPIQGDSILHPRYSGNFPTLSMSFGINYLPNKTTTLKIHLGKSYRLPSVYELASNGFHKHEARYVQGSTDNNPEQAWQFDVGIDKKWKKMQVSASPFVNYFTNYLYLMPSSDFKTGAFTGQIYKYQQNKALMAGTEATLGYKINSHFNFYINAEYVYAVNLDMQMAIPATPPFASVAEIGYTFSDKNKWVKPKISIEANMVAAQNYTVPNELSTPGYVLFSAMAKTEINAGNQNIEMMLKVHNILNTSYYNHISFYRRLRIPEMGRNIQVYISVPFQKLNHNKP